MGQHQVGMLFQIVMGQEHHLGADILKFYISMPDKDIFTCQSQFERPGVGWFRKLSDLLPLGVGYISGVPTFEWLLVFLFRFTMTIGLLIC